MKSSEFILTESQILEESIKAKVAKLAAAGIISLGVGIAIPRIMDAYQYYEKVEQILLTVPISERMEVMKINELLLDKTLSSINNSKENYYV